MASTTNIAWCDATFNPWLGCRKVAPECVNCYITSTPPFKFRGIKHGSDRFRTAESTWKQPLAWNRKAAKDGVRRKVFCLSLGDWLDDENVPVEWLADLLKLIHDTPNLDWLLITKRPQNFAERMEDAFRFCTIEQPKPIAHEGLSDPHFLNWMTGWHVQDGCEEGEPDQPPANVWIGVSAGADQEAALAIPARIHFLSCEPMLHAVDLSLWLCDNPVNEDAIPGAENISSCRSGIGDRRPRKDLENGGSKRHEGEQGDAFDSMRSPEGGACPSEGVSSDQGDGKREEDQCLRAPVGVAPLQRPDSERDGREPQIWDSTRQQAERIGATNESGKHPARCQRDENSPQREPAQREQFSVQDNGHAGGNDSISESVRGELEGHCEGLPDNRPASFQDRAGASPKKWVILGGESGSKARRCSTEWIRNAVRQCQFAGVPVFVKQMGSNCVDPTGEPLRLKDSHGGDMEEWPQDLRVREFPKVDLFPAR